MGLGEVAAICYELLWFVWPVVKHPAIGAIVLLTTDTHTHIHTYTQTTHIHTPPGFEPDWETQWKRESRLLNH